MRRVLVTGSSGFIGRRLVADLVAAPSVERVVGLDLVEPASAPSGLEFVRADVRRDAARLLAGRRIDTVVHAAWVLRPIHEIAVAEEINVEGTRRLLESCRRAGVGQLVHLSSANVYGFPPASEVPIHEDNPRRADDEFFYAKNKREAEDSVAEVARREPGMVVTVLRPSTVVGAGADNPLWAHLRRRRVLVPTGAKRLQLTHVDDLAAVVRLMIERRIAGVFNVGAGGALSLEEMAAALGRRFVKVPYFLLRAFLRVSWDLRLGSAAVPAPALELLRHSWVVSSERLLRETGFEFRFTSRQAFEDLARDENTRRVSD